MLIWYLRHSYVGKSNTDEMKTQDRRSDLQNSVCQHPLEEKYGLERIWCKKEKETQKSDKEI